MPSHPLMVGESRLHPRVVSAVPGMLRPTPSHLVVPAAALVEQRFEAFGDVGHQFVGSDADLLVDIGHGQHLAGQIADTELGAASADGRGQHDAGVGIEDQPRRGTAPGRRRFGAFEHQPGCLQRGDPSRDGGAGQPGDASDLGAGGHSSITNQGEHLARRSPVPAGTVTCAYLPFNQLVTAHTTPKVRLLLS